MSNLPCDNPKCGSYGKPHPNCKCHLEMAKGGVVPDDDIPEDMSSQTPQSVDAVPADDIPQELSAPQPAADNAVPADDIPAGMEPTDAEDTAADIPNEGVDRSTKYETPKQQALGDVEGLAHGLTFGASDIIENKILGVPAEDIEGRKSDNPWSHGASELAGTMLGPGKILKGAKIGSAMVKQAIESGLVATGDEVSKWALGQGDPNDGAGAALAHVALSTILGMIGGKAGSAAQKPADKILNSAAEAKLGERANYFLYGVSNAMKKNAITNGLEGAALEGSEAEQGIKGVMRNSGIPPAMAKAYEAGHKWFEGSTSRLLPMGMGALGEGAYGAKKGYDEDGIAGALWGAGKGAFWGSIHGLGASTGAGVTKWAAKKYGAPVLLKILSNRGVVGSVVPGVTGAMDHVANMAAGFNATQKVVQGALNTGARTGEKLIESYGDPKIRDKIDKYLENDELGKNLQDQTTENDAADVPNFAKGGSVVGPEDPSISGDHGRATHYPEQNMIMSAAKGRMINYLNNLRPPKVHPKLAFDDDPDTTVQKKRYDKAVDIAANPLGIMQEIKDGTIDPETMSHFKALHPEVEGLLNKQITAHIVKGQMKGEKPPFHVRQGLSLFMGTPLASDFSPSNIQAAQATFSAAKQKSQSSGGQAPKIRSSSAPLSKSDASFLTDDQAREKRQQKV